MSRLLLSFFYSGLLKPAPGTWGSLAAIPVAWLFHNLGGPVTLLLACTFFFSLGLQLLHKSPEAGADPGWVVIDEAVGQWIALLPVSLGAMQAGVGFFDLWPGVAAAFLLFRLFDIWKPWLVGRADAKGGPMSVMLDDVWAGIFAAVGVGLLALAAHGVMALVGAP